MSKKMPPRPWMADECGWTWRDVVDTASGLRCCHYSIIFRHDSQLEISTIFAVTSHKSAATTSPNFKHIRRDLFHRAICDIVQHWIAILNFLSCISFIKHFSCCFFSVSQYHIIIRYVIRISCNNSIFSCTHGFALLNLHFSPQLVHNKAQKPEKNRKK